MSGWVIGVGLWGLFVLVAWALCVAARRADDKADRMHEDLRRKEWNDE